MSKNFGHAAIIAAAMVAGALAGPALAAGGPGGGGGGGGTGGGGGSAPTIVNYKLTGTIVAPAGCNGGVQLGYQEICAAFATGTPFTLTYTVNLSTQANLQNTKQDCAASLAVDTNPGTIQTTRTVALFSKAVSNINLQLANGVAYAGSGADVSLENDTCLASGVSAWDIYSINAQSLSGPNSFPSFSNGTATVSFVLALADMASVVDPNSPLPPSALTSLSLPTAAPEAHLLQDNSRLTAIMFRFPTVGQASWGVGLPISTWEVVP
jgi:hypothetical protein